MSSLGGLGRRSLGNRVFGWASLRSSPELVCVFFFYQNVKFIASLIV